jgi:hypothetical protein
MEEKLFDLVGLKIPFALAAATYAVFAWLDNNASDEIALIISSWLHGRSHNKPDLGNLIINAFDRIYTSPLLTFKAFLRSAAVSTVIWLLVYLIPLVIAFHFLPSGSDVWTDMKILSLPKFFIEVLSSLPLIIISDYVSLFFVRKFLNLARAHPLKATIGAFIVGLLIVITLLVLFVVAILVSALISIANIGVVDFIVSGGSSFGILLPALIIHLWLPLFALSSWGVRLVYLILRAVEWAQWFIKQGDAHPLKAVGIVATIIVFGSAMLVKEA